MKKYVIGIDEVGRGALAGPIVVAAVCAPKGFRIVNKKLGKLRDSKKLSPQKRRLWFEYIKNNPKISFSSARIYESTIEKKNISYAANAAALRAFNKIIKKQGLRPNSIMVLLDGGLFLGNRKSKFSKLKDVKTIIRGDEKIAVIKAASIMAKVLRDRYMSNLSKKYPKYGFDKNKGYGTYNHRLVIARYGLCQHHRKSFLTKII